MQAEDELSRAVNFARGLAEISSRLDCIDRQVGQFLSSQFELQACSFFPCDLVGEVVRFLKEISFWVKKTDFGHVELWRYRERCRARKSQGTICHGLPSTPSSSSNRPFNGPFLVTSKQAVFPFVIHWSKHEIVLELWCFKASDGVERFVLRAYVHNVAFVWMFQVGLKVAVFREERSRVNRLISSRNLGRGSSLLFCIAVPCLSRE